MTSAGLAQRLEHQPTPPKRAPAGDVGTSPTPRSTILRAFVAGLQRDVSSNVLGYADGKSGAPFNPPASGDLLSYATGYHEARGFRRPPAEA